MKNIKQVKYVRCQKVLSGTEKNESKQVVEEEVGLEMRTWFLNTRNLNTRGRENHTGKVIKDQEWMRGQTTHFRQEWSGGTLVEDQVTEAPMGVGADVQGYGHAKDFGVTQKATRRLQTEGGHGVSYTLNVYSVLCVVNRLKWERSGSKENGGSLE